MNAHLWIPDEDVSGDVVSRVADRRLVERLKALEARIRALEERPIRSVGSAIVAREGLTERINEVEKRLSEALFFKGVYAEGVEYQPGDLVQHAGTVWVAKEAPTGKPGDDGSGWRMLVKTR